MLQRGWTNRWTGAAYATLREPRSDREGGRANAEGGSGWGLAHAVVHCPAVYLWSPTRDNETIEIVIPNAVVVFGRVAVRPDVVLLVRAEPGDARQQQDRGRRCQSALVRPCKSLLEAVHCTIVCC